MIKVFVAVPCSEQARSHRFYVSLASQSLPEGVTMSAPVPCFGAYIPWNQNTLADTFLQTDATHFWLTNDDQVYPIDTLGKLLRHDADVAVPLCLSRAAPFQPLIYRQMGIAVVPRTLEPDMKGAIPIAASGGGGMLIKRHVLETIARPWWETNTVWLQNKPRMMTEDLDFCRKVASAGFKMVCDLEAMVGHEAHFTIWPGRNPDGSWYSGINRESATIRMDQPTEADLDEMKRRETMEASRV